MEWLGSRLGFGFSAGLFDYMLNYGRSTPPLYLFPVGASLLEPATVHLLHADPISLEIALAAGA